MSASTLGTLVHEFFMNHLEQKGLRQSSVRSYRDTGSRMGERPKSDSARGRVRSLTRDAPLLILGVKLPRPTHKISSTYKCSLHILRILTTYLSSTNCDRHSGVRRAPIAISRRRVKFRGPIFQLPRHPTVAQKMI